MKKITYEEILSGKKFDGYREEAEYILSLIKDGTIKPIQSSPKNGKRPALHTGYWLVPAPTDESEYIEELQCKISTLIDIDYYLNHMDTYRKERGFVLQLSDYLYAHRDRLSVCISENERSFEIWKKEKFLSGKSYEGVSAGSVLKHCGIARDFLNTYRTAEPLAYYSCSRETPQNMLVLENLDPFYSMRRHLLSCHHTICGMRFGTLIYGGGDRVARIFDDFELSAEPYMLSGCVQSECRAFCNNMADERETYEDSSGNRIYYVGDLDYEGIGIFEGLLKRQQDKRAIYPCMEIYNRMLDKVTADILSSLPQMKNQNRIDISGFLSYFSDERRTLLEKILEAGRYVPQEILSITDYERG